MSSAGTWMYKEERLDIYINREKYESRVTQKNRSLLTKLKDYPRVKVRENKESEKCSHMICAFLTETLKHRVAKKS